MVSETRSYRGPGMSRAHRERAVSEEVSRVAGVEAVEVDLEAKLVSVRGASVSDAAERAAIDEAGYEVEER